MAEGTLQINTEKLLPIIKKWLYSSKDIFLRELVSNACDAISKLKILQDEGQTTFADDELRIDITLDKEKKTLTISDTGIGMTASEVEKYIAQLAFSGAEEFLSKYQTSNENDQVIGHFGLGFYSAYMVASKVEIDTKSYSDAPPAFWSCDGGALYTIEEGKRQERGTTITLYIEEEEFLEEAKIKEILRHYCSFLPYPIFFGEEQINAEEPLWLKNPSECTEAEYLAFYRKLHPMEPDPIFWVHLNVDFPFHLKGILYFPRIEQRFDFQKSPIKLFCNRVFVSDQCQDLLPDAFTILHGALDSPDIPLNVSRSYLQVDKTVRSLSAHIAKKVADRLAAIYRTDREKFVNEWENIETIIKLGALQDEKFYDRVKDLLIWKNLDGDWTTVSDYLEKSPEKIYYTHDETAPSLHIYREQGLEVLIAKGPIDMPLMNFLESKIPSAKFQRIDGGLDEPLLDKEREKTLLNKDGRTEAAELADFVRSALDEKEVEVEAKSLASDELPALLVLDEQMRRFRDTMALSKQQLPQEMVGKHSFIVNTNSPLINAAFRHKDRELAKEVMQTLYQFSKLSQRELAVSELPKLIERNRKILEKLLQSE